MKTILFLFFLLNVYFCFGQKGDDTNKLVVRVGLKAAKKVDTATQIKLFADSINTYSDGALPHFLFDACMDWNKLFWKDLHSPVSVRWLILQKVTNKSSLKIILQLRDKRTKVRCKHISDHVYPYLTVPLIKKTSYQLIKKRYKEL